MVTIEQVEVVSNCDEGKDMTNWLLAYGAVAYRIRSVATFTLVTTLIAERSVISSNYFIANPILLYP